MQTPCLPVSRVLLGTLPDLRHVPATAINARRMLEDGKPFVQPGFSDFIRNKKLWYRGRCLRRRSLLLDVPRVP